MKIKNCIKIGAIFFICLALTPSISYGLNLSRVKTWSAGEVLTADDLNAEFNNILNHSITNSDVASNAAIVASKLDLTTGTPIGSTSPSTGAFTTLSSTGDTTLGNGTGDDLTLNFPDGLTFTPAATWTFSANQTVSGTWANLGTVTTIDINGGTIDGITDLAVADGGTGVSTLTDGGVLLGSGTGAITAMGVLADGEMIVGDGTTDPVAESGATLRTSIGVAIGTDVQAYDADLTTYAGITPSANIQSLLGSADYATARTNLGVAIGTNVQAYDAQLDDLADGSLSGAGTIAWTAMPTASCRIKVGTYTGDGAATKAITGVGFPPDDLIVWPQQSGQAGPFYKTSSDGTKAYYDQGSSPYYEDDYIISLDADGFTVGDGTSGSTVSHLNRNGVTYTYRALGD